MTKRSDSAESLEHRFTITLLPRGGVHYFERSMSIMNYVYVVDRKGNPLMPTKRFGRVRGLLKSGNAVPICNKPFTIRLKYDVPGFTQPIHEGIDTGRENIGRS